MSSGNVNKIILLGNLGQNPELRHTPKGNPVVTLSLATHKDQRTAEGSTKQETQWHKAIVWGKRAEACAKYLVKGSRVYLEGELQTRKWIDKEGKSIRSPEILVNQVYFLGDGKKTEIKPSENQEVDSAVL